jgi:hypothetical protein
MFALTAINLHWPIDQSVAASTVNSVTVVSPQQQYIIIRDHGLFVGGLKSHRSINGLSPLTQSDN